MSSLKDNDIGYSILHLSRFCCRRYYSSKWGIALKFLDSLASPAHVGWATTALVLTIVVSLAFDITDVIRYILGKRGPMVPVTG